MDANKNETSKKTGELTIFGASWRIVAIFFMGFTVFMVVSSMMLQFLTKPVGEVTVPDVTGKRFMDAYNSIIRKDLRPEITYRDVNDIDDGIILEQSPEAGKVTYENSKLKLVVSRSEILLDVPNVAGISLSMAKNKLTNLHYHERPVSLSLGMVTFVPSDKTAENIVITQIPAAGEKIKPERKVHLLVSAGKTETDQKMPDVTGQSIDLCFDLLLAKGVFVEEEIVNVVKPEESGLVAAQSPAKDTPLQKGDTVKLKVNLYPSKDRPYTFYEKIEFKIPNDEKEGIYEAYVEDHTSKRVRFYRKMKPGEIMRFVFYRNGNAKVTILREKKSLRVLNVKAD